MGKGERKTIEYHQTKITDRNTGGQEIRSSGGHGVRRSGVREGFILEEGGRQLDYDKINTHHFIMCF